MYRLTCGLKPEDIIGKSLSPCHHCPVVSFKVIILCGLFNSSLCALVRTDIHGHIYIYICFFSDAEPANLLGVMHGASSRSI